MASRVNSLRVSITDPPLMRCEDILDAFLNTKDAKGNHSRAAGHTCLLQSSQHAEITAHSLCSPCSAISPGLRAQSSSGAATALPEDLKAKIDAAANQILSSTKVPSASIAIVKDGRIAYLQAYGQARLSPPMEATPQMQYSIGSISKQFTAAAVLFLAQEGKLTLNDPVSKYLPELTRAMKSPSACCFRTPPATRTTGRRIT